MDNLKNSWNQERRVKEDEKDLQCEVIIKMNG